MKNGVKCSGGDNRAIRVLLNVTKILRGKNGAALRAEGTRQTVTKRGRQSLVVLSVTNVVGLILVSVLIVALAYNELRFVDMKVINTQTIC